MAGGLLNTSLQFGGALVLAVVSAVLTAQASPAGGRQTMLDGFHAATVVSLIVVAVGVVVTALRRRARTVPAPEPA